MFRHRRTAAVAFVAAASSAALTVALMPTGGSLAGAARVSRAHARAGGPGMPPGVPVIGLAFAALHPDHAAGGPPPGPPPSPGQRPSRSALFAAIGAKLGKSGDDVGAAVRSAIVKRLDQAVSDGKLTSGQRDAILARWDSDTPPDGPHPAGGPDGAGRPGPPPGGMRGPCRAGGPPRDVAKQIAAFRADVASALGVSTDDLVKAIDDAAPTRR